MKHKYLSAIIFTLLAFTGCEKDDIITNGGGNGNNNPHQVGMSVNEWIESTMRDEYLWYQEIPSKSSLNFKADPHDFFYSLLSQKDGKSHEGGHHYFSTIERHQVTKGIDSSNSYGFDFALSNLLDGNKRHNIALVTYVLKDSPADRAGLKRGDWILGVNGPAGSIKDYSMLEYGGNVTLQLGKIEIRDNAEVMVPSKKINLTASGAVNETPFLKDSVYSIGGKKIGYLMYNYFAAGPNEYDPNDNTFNNQMQKLFMKFKSMGVNEFVLDLRYNGGGMVTCAQLLSSLLAKKEALGNVLCNIEYNDKNSKNNYAMKLLNSGEVVAGNLDLSRLFVLTGATTASASELIINSLRPYINVRTIGAQTVGKTVGMSVYDKSKEYGWVISPVTFRIYNKNHEANYENGIVPDVKINEYESDLVDFGNLNDPLLRQAINEITGRNHMLRSEATNMNNLEIQYEPRQRVKGNLLMEGK